MFGSNRIGQLTLALVALVCAIFMAGVMYGLVSEQYAKVHQVNAAYQKNAEADRQKTNDEIAQACHGGDFIAFRNCISNKLETYYKDQATNEDLNAQKDMAFWAFWLLLATVLSILISLAGLYLLLDSLRQTRRSISDTREIGQAQVRAYLTCKDATFEITEMGISVKPKFHNSGTSPSSEISISAYIRPANALFGLAHGLQPASPVLGGGHGPCINAGESEFGRIHWHESKDIYDSELGLGHFTVNATASWKDVFGVWCELDFRLDIKEASHDLGTFDWIVYEGTMNATNQQFRVLGKKAQHHQ